MLAIHQINNKRTNQQWKGICEAGKFISMEPFCITYDPLVNTLRRNINQTGDFQI